MAGLALAGLLETAIDPGAFMKVASALDSALVQEAGRMLRPVLERGELEAEQARLLEEGIARAVGWASLRWPVLVFVGLWLGIGPALAFAAAGARAGGALARKARVAERCSLFRLPHAWLWVLLAGMGIFLSTRRGPAHELALDAALVAAGMYAWQGAAIALYYLERRGIRPVARALLLTTGFVVLALPALVFALCLGLADVWLDLRFREEQAPPGAPGA